MAAAFGNQSVRVDPMGSQGIGTGQQTHSQPHGFAHGGGYILLVVRSAQPLGHTRHQQAYAASGAVDFHRNIHGRCSRSKEEGRVQQFGLVRTGRPEQDGNAVGSMVHIAHVRTPGGSARRGGAWREQHRRRAAVARGRCPSPSDACGPASPHRKVADAPVRAVLPAAG